MTEIQGDNKKSDISFITEREKIIRNKAIAITIALMCCIFAIILAIVVLMYK